MLKIAVVGAAGRMGKSVCEAVRQAPDLELVAQLDSGDDISVGSLNGAQVTVEFTVPAVSLTNVKKVLAAGSHVVVGTTGWNEEKYRAVAACCEESQKHAFIAPNFAMSAVLVMEFARLAAPYFESVEVVETHHPDKVDAPSGTAITTADIIAQARKDAGLGQIPDATESELTGARGAKVQDINVHALRIRGATAHQQVIFGNLGEMLQLTTDCFGRESFMPGVLLAVRKIEQYPGLTIGLDKLLQLGSGNDR